MPADAKIWHDPETRPPRTDSRLVPGGAERGTGAMNAVLAEIVASGQVRCDDGEPVPVHSAVGAEAGAWLQDVVRAVAPAPGLTLEIGLGYGVSALFLCDVLQQLGARRHIVVDPFQHVGPEHGAERWSGIGLANLRRAGFQQLVDFREAPSYVVIPELIRNGEWIDFAFIDGWTTFDAKLVDFFLADRALRTGGVIVVRGGLTPAGLATCRYVAANRPDYEICGTFPANLGFGGIGQELTAFRKLCDDYRSWTDHAAF
jgi:predicted O-methyltransferase YrrM